MKRWIVFSEHAYAQLSIMLFNWNSEFHIDGCITRSIKGQLGGEREMEYYIDHFIVPPQEVGACHTYQDAPGIADWLNSLSDDEFNSRRCFLHSHVDMSVNPSGTDIENQEEYIKILGEHDFAVFVIANKKGEFYIRIVDNEFPMTEDDMVYIEAAGLTDWVREADRNIKEKKYGSSINPEIS